MKFSTGAGSAMHLDAQRVKFRLGARPGPKQALGSSHIPKIRKLLRTEKSIAEIAEELGVTLGILKWFIKRRAICDMQARCHFNTLQRSIAREGAIR